MMISLGNNSRSPNEKKLVIRKEFRFSVRLCSDVLLQVFWYGNRYQLAKLERIGWRFCHLIDTGFRETLLIRLNLFWYSHLFNSYIGRPKSFKIISNFDFAALPPYLHFDEVELNYKYGEKSIHGEFLQSLSTRVKGSKLVFHGNINENHPTDFKNHFQLLYYIGNELLPLFNSCCAYKFLIEFHSDKESATEFVSSILQMDSIRRSTNVSVLIYLIDWYQRMQLPEEAIKNWLIFKSEAKGNSAKGSRKMEERFLQIKMNGIENGSEMRSCLKEAAEHAITPFTFNFGGFHMQEPEQIISSTNV